MKFILNSISGIVMLDYKEVKFKLWSISSGVKYSVVKGKHVLSSLTAKQKGQMKNER